MNRDNNASGLIPLTDDRISNKGWKEENATFSIKADWDHDYVLVWTASLQAYNMGIRENKTGKVIYFCWDLKFVQELDRLIIGLTGEC